jgi:hypothetical protein
MTYVPYVPTSWKETGMSIDDKVYGLNNLETQAQNGEDYITQYLHDDNYYPKLGDPGIGANETFFRTPAHPTLPRSDTGHGCLIDAGSVDGYNLAQLQALAIPSGAIALWAKSIAAIPTARWLHCNGLNSTPDFRGRLLVGAGGGYSPGQSGGGASVTPYCSAFDPTAVALTTNQIPKHQHTYSDTYNTGTSDAAGSDYPMGNVGPVQGYADITRDINGIPNVSPSEHGHPGSTYTNTGYYDDNSILHSGAVPLLPKSKAYAYILRR